MCAMNRQYELRNQQWERIKPYFTPERQQRRGRPAKDSRQMINAILWVLGTGLPWRELPERYGEWSTVYKRYVKWKRSGLLERIFNELELSADGSVLLDGGDTTQEKNG